MKAPVRIPSPEEVEGLEKSSSLTDILEEVCERLYRLMTRQEYDQQVLRKVLTVSQGISSLRKFVAWAIRLLEQKSALQVAT